MAAIVPELTISIVWPLVAPEPACLTPVAMALAWAEVVNMPVPTEASAIALATSIPEELIKSISIVADAAVPLAPWDRPMAKASAVAMVAAPAVALASMSIWPLLVMATMSAALPTAPWRIPVAVADGLAVEVPKRRNRRADWSRSCSDRGG